MILKPSSYSLYLLILCSIAEKRYTTDLRKYGCINSDFYRSLGRFICRIICKRSILQGIGLVTALGGLVLSLVALNSEVFDLRHMLIFDHYALAFTALMCLATFLVFLASGYGFRQLGETLGDNYGLILFSLCGGFVWSLFKIW